MVTMDQLKFAGIHCVIHVLVLRPVHSAQSDLQCLQCALVALVSYYSSYSSLVRRAIGSW